MAAALSDRVIQKIDQAADEYQRLYVPKYQFKLQSKQIIQRFSEKTDGHG